MAMQFIISYGDCNWYEAIDEALNEVKDEVIFPIEFIEFGKNLHEKGFENGIILSDLDRICDEAIIIRGPLEYQNYGRLNIVDRFLMDKFDMNLSMLKVELEGRNLYIFSDNFYRNSEYRYGEVYESVFLTDTRRVSEFVDRIVIFAKKYCVERLVYMPDLESFGLVDDIYIRNFEKVSKNFDLNFDIINPDLTKDLIQHDTIIVCNKYIQKILSSLYSKSMQISAAIGKKYSLFFPRVFDGFYTNLESDKQSYEQKNQMVRVMKFAIKHSIDNMFCDEKSYNFENHFGTDSVKKIGISVLIEASNHVGDLLRELNPLHIQNIFSLGVRLYPFFDRFSMPEYKNSDKAPINLDIIIENEVSNKKIMEILEFFHSKNLDVLSYKLLYEI